MFFVIFQHIEVLAMRCKVTLIFLLGITAINGRVIGGYNLPTYPTQNTNEFYPGAAVPNYIAKVYGDTSKIVRLPLSIERPCKYTYYFHALYVSLLSSLFAFKHAIYCHPSKITSGRCPQMQSLEASNLPRRSEMKDQRLTKKSNEWHHSRTPTKFLTAYYRIWRSPPISNRWRPSW